MKKHNRNISLIMVVLIFIGVLVLFNVINERLKPKLNLVAREECKKFATMIINDAVKKQVVNGLTFDKLFITTYDKGKISSIDFDTIIVNKVLTNITNTIQMNLKSIEKGNIKSLDLSDNIFAYYDSDKLNKGIIYEIPLSIAYNNTFLSNLTPRVPVRISLIGSVNSNIRTEVKNYGINNALIEVYVDISVNLQVMMPFESSKNVVKTSVPLALKLIKGDIPNYLTPYLNYNESVL